MTTSRPTSRPTGSPTSRPSSSPTGSPAPGLLRDTRVYLSGPMDFVASRAEEKAHGWRNRVGEFLREFEVTVFDPFVKPEVRGLFEYGREGASTDEDRERWSFARTREAARARAWCAHKYYATQHIDLRMVDTSDFVICYCPTNIYSVGTPHEIIVARNEHKPVLFVSPPINCPSLDELHAHLRGRGDDEGDRLLDRVEQEAPIKPNERGIPSLWYMPLIGENNFFDGFGFAPYRERFGWERIALDDHEDGRTIENPLLPFLEELDVHLPDRYSARERRSVPDDDWILWQLDGHAKGSQITDVAAAEVRDAPPPHE